MRDDEFYVGYEPVVPPRAAGRVRRVVAGMIAGGLACAAFAVGLHQRLQPSRFDFGRPHAVEGTLRRIPYPALDDDGRVTWLVGTGKHGADEALAGIPDGKIRLEGTTIARGPHEMLEIVPGSIEADARAGVPALEAAARHISPGGEEVTLTGEIVDSKCFLGVMNPGEGTVHRDCARMCLRGGIPPMLLVRGGAGEEALVLLVSESGQPIGVELANLAGQPVEMRGRLARDGDALVLHANGAPVRLLR